MTLETLDAWFRHGQGWWLLVGGVAAWIIYGGMRGAWRRWDAKRRRRAFVAREERRWQGHRRERGSVGRIDRK